MVVLDNILYNVLSNYFNALTKLGYMSKQNVDKLLILIFICELLERLITDYNIILSEDEYRIICKALSNLYGSSCLIPYPQYKAGAHILCDNEEFI